MAAQGAVHYKVFPLFPFAAEFFMAGRGRKKATQAVKTDMKNTTEISTAAVSKKAGKKGGEKVSKQVDAPVPVPREEKMRRAKKIKVSTGL